MPVHDLDWPSVPNLVYQFGIVEFGCYQQGTNLVRHL